MKKNRKNVNEIEIKRLKQEERIALAKMTPKQQQEYYKLKKQFEMGESKQREKKKRPETPLGRNRKNVLFILVSVIVMLITT